MDIEKEEISFKTEEIYRDARVFSLAISRHHLRDKCTERSVRKNQSALLFSLFFYKSMYIYIRVYTHRHKEEDKKKTGREALTGFFLS